MRKGKVTGRAGLTIDQLANVAEKSLANSLELLADAESLLGEGSYPRAFALGVLAAEEFGKLLMCLGALGRDQDDAEFWTDFWDRFTRHKPKYSNAGAFLGTHLVDEKARRQFMEAIREHVEFDQGRKLASLYVDVNGAGDVVAPWEAIDPRSAENLLLVVGTVIRAYAERVAGLDWAAQFHEDWSAAAEVQAAIKANDQELLRKLFLKRGGIDLDQ